MEPEDGLVIELNFKAWKSVHFQMYNQK